MRFKSIPILLAALALVAGACGGGGGSQSPADAIAAASTNTSEAGSARVSIASKVTLPEAMAAQGRSSIEFGGEGLVDYENQVGQMTMDMSDMGGAPGTPQLGDMNMIFDGTMIYMQFDLLAQQLPKGKSWVRFDLATVGEEMGVDMSQFTQFSNNDPTASLAYLEGATDLEEVGSDEVRGEETTHYEGVVDLQAAADKVEDEKLSKAIEDLIEIGGQKEVPLEVWIDGEDRIARMMYAFETPAGQGSTDSLTSEITIEFFDFGTEVDVTIPSDDESVDLQEMIGAPAP